MVISLISNIMDRRTYLFSTGSLITAGLAGCTDGMTSADDPDNESESSNNVDVDALIQSADDSLNSAADDFLEQSEELNDPISSDSYSIETRTIETHLSDAEDDLAEAKPAADNEQLATINALEDSAMFMRELVRTVAIMGEVRNEIDTANDYIDSERYSDCVQTLKQTEDSVTDASVELSEARSSFNQIDEDALSGVEQIDIIELEITLDEWDAVIIAMDYFVVGLREMVEGMIPFDEAMTAIEAEQYSRADTKFSESSRKFYTAYTTFKEAEGEVSQEYRSDAIEMTCMNESMSDAADYLARSAAASNEGRYRDAERLAEDATSALERCEGMNDEF